MVTCYVLAVRYHYIHLIDISESSPAEPMWLTHEKFQSLKQPRAHKRFLFGNLSKCLLIQILISDLLCLMTLSERLSFWKCVVCLTEAQLLT